MANRNVQAKEDARDQNNDITLLKEQLEVIIFIILSICLSDLLSVCLSKCILSTAVGEWYCNYYCSDSIYCLRSLYISHYIVDYIPSHHKSFVTFQIKDDLIIKFQKDLETMEKMRSQDNIERGRNTDISRESKAGDEMGDSIDPKETMKPEDIERVCTGPNFMLHQVILLYSDTYLSLNRHH